MDRLIIDIQRQEKSYSIYVYLSVRVSLLNVPHELQANTSRRSSVGLMLGQHWSDAPCLLGYHFEVFIVNLLTARHDYDRF